MEGFCNLEMKMQMQMAENQLFNLKYLFFVYPQSAPGIGVSLEQ